MSKPVGISSGHHSMSRAAWAQAERSVIPHIADGRPSEVPGGAGPGVVVGEVGRLVGGWPK
ncbi:MAG: hypothetical protein ACRDYZ_16545 [Acidimicrobiales bacterium]